MRIASLFASLLLASSATASAHETGFNAVWVQPVAPVVTRAAIVPLGWTHGLAPDLDLAVELTPYYAGGPENGCLGSGCRDGLYGLIATTGIAFGKTIGAGEGWEVGWFVGPKVLAAVAHEQGIGGGPSQEPPFVPGTAYEVGGGLDLGLEVHSRRLGLYGALVVGVQASALFNYAATDIGGAPPSSPVRLVDRFSTGQRHNDVAAGLNLNLLRIGLAF